MGKSIVSLVTLIQSSEMEFSPLGIEAEVQEIAYVVHPLSKTMGGGICRMKECTLNHQLRYDEAIFVQSGSMFILHNSEKLKAKQGDIYFMKEGAIITYGTDEEVEFFFTTYPVNWKEVKKDVQYENTEENLVTLIQRSKMEYQPLGIEAEVQEIAPVINTLSTSMGGGTCRLKECSFSRKIKYDEILHVAKGSMYIIHNGERISAKQGDIYFLKDGAEITYGTDEEVEFHFTLYPLNLHEMQ